MANENQAPAEPVIEDIHNHHVRVPYMEYPRHLHKPGGLTKIVADDEARDAAVKAGWALQAFAEDAGDDGPAAGDAPAKKAKK